MPVIHGEPSFGARINTPLFPFFGILYSRRRSKFENFLLVASHCEPSFPVQDNTPSSIIQLDGSPPMPCQPVRFLPSKSDKNPFSVAWICVAQISVMAQTSDFTLRS